MSWKRERERERETQADPTLSTGLDLTTVGSDSSRNRGRPTDRPNQVPQESLFQASKQNKFTERVEESQAASDVSTATFKARR